jgi:hypothetical protein
MAAQAVFVMRAFRGIDSSYFVWRAGEFDDDMSEANPPNPPGEYSDHTVIGFIGGPLARTDTTALSPVGLGTSGTPVTFPVAGAPLLETSPGTDCQDFTSISYWVNVTNLAGGTSLTVQVLWGMEETPAGAGDYGFQASDDQITAGASPQAVYTATYDLTGGITSAFGPFNVPVRGRFCRLVISSDNGAVEGYVRAIRVA